MALLPRALHGEWLLLVPGGVISGVPDIEGVPAVSEVNLVTVCSPSPFPPILILIGSLGIQDENLLSLFRSPCLRNWS